MTGIKLVPWSGRLASGRSDLMGMLLVGAFPAGPGLLMADGLLFVLI